MKKPPEQPPPPEEPSQPPPGDPVAQRLAELEAALAAREEAISELSAKASATALVLADTQAVVNRQAMTICIAAENAQELSTSRSKGKKLEARMLDTKEAAAAAKKAYESWVDQHFELEDTLSSGQQKLPFPEEPPRPASPPRPAPDPAPAAAPDPEPAAAEEPLAQARDYPLDDAWKFVLLSKLGIAREIPGGILQALGEADLFTLGDLALFTAPPIGSAHGRLLTDITGIGRAKADKIEKALDEFWVLWAQQQADKQAAAEANRSGEPSDPAATDGDEAAATEEPPPDEPEVDPELFGEDEDEEPFGDDEEAELDDQTE